MDKEFFRLREQINNSKNQDEINKIVSELVINVEDIDDWIDKIFSKEIEEFDFNKVPYLLDSLYRENNKIKFMLFCMFLEATFEKIPFITNLENIPIFKEKLELLEHTLVTVSRKFL